MTAFKTAGQIDSEAQPRDVTQYVGYISYSFVHAIDTWNTAAHPLKVFLGTGLSTFVNNTDFNAVDATWNYTFYDQSWYWSHAINLHLRGEYRLAERRSLSLQLTMPVAQLVSRPANSHYFADKNREVTDNFMNAATQGKSAFLWDNFVLLGEMEYRQRLGKNFDLHGTYWFGFASSDRPLTMGMYMNNFLAGFLWVF